MEYTFNDQILGISAIYNADAITILGIHIGSESKEGDTVDFYDPHLQVDSIAYGGGEHEDAGHGLWAGENDATVSYTDPKSGKTTKYDAKVSANGEPGTGKDRGFFVTFGKKR